MTREFLEKAHPAPKIQRAIDFLRTQPDMSRKSILRVCEQVPCSERWGYEAKERLLIRLQKGSEELKFLKDLYSDLNFLTTIIMETRIPLGFTTQERVKWEKLTERYEALEKRIERLREETNAAPEHG